MDAYHLQVSSLMDNDMFIVSVLQYHDFCTEVSAWV